MLKFDDKFFEAEVRSGFYVPSRMKRTWASQLEILADFDKICRKYNIKYFAEWGTMLGTVRHKGFIPWDDDLDVCMKREDYTKFVAIAEKEFGDKYFLVNYKVEEEYWDVMSRMINTERIQFSGEFLDAYHQCPYITGVDIFPMDYLPRDEEQQKIQKDLIILIKYVADMYGCGKMEGEELEQRLSEIELITAQPIDRDKPIREQLYTLFQVVYAMYTEEEADELVQMGLWVENGGHGYPKEFYEDIMYMPFENIEIPVPVGYDTLLRSKYGDYMKLVKGGGASTHEYPLYAKMEEDLAEHDIHLAEYKYDPAELQAFRDVSIRAGLKDNGVNLTTLLKRATEAIPAILAQGQASTALDILNQCQDGIIGLGNTIEQAAGTDCPTIKLIEEYCELIYQVYQAISQGNEFDSAAVCGLLIEQLDNIQNSILEDVNVRRVVVFLPYRADYWDAMRSVWEAECAKEDTDVYVVPIPYFYKSFYGDITGTVYEGNDFPKDIPVISFEEFDIKQIHPDTIYIQNPYDEYDDVAAVHPHFFAKNLRQYTDDLVYIPYFVTDEIDFGNPREVGMMKHYVTTPGVVNADRVILQSEQMKQAYITKLCEWAGEDTRTIWEEKLFGTGSPLEEARKHITKADADVPKEWDAYLKKSDGSYKKILLYSFNVSGILEYKDKAFEKIKYSLDIIKEQKEDIAFIWLPQSNIIDNLTRLDSDLAKKYIDTVNEFIREDWGIYDADEHLKGDLLLADAYYGCAGEIAQLVRASGKPVMLHNIEI